MRSEIYFDERQNRKRRRILKLKIYSGLAAFFILLTGFAYLIIYSPIFKIKNINFIYISEDKTLGKSLNKEEVVNDLKNVLICESRLAKFLSPNNILSWKNYGFDYFFKIYPQIAELEIKKEYFKRQVDLSIKERERKGIWCLKTKTDVNETQINTEGFYESSCWWFDKNGIIFEQAPLIEGNLINKINDFSGRTIQIGELALKENLFSNLLKIFEVLKKSDLNVKSFRLERIELQEIIAESSPEIYFSLRINPEFALSALESIKAVGFEKIQYIDLRVENRAYYKIK